MPETETRATPLTAAQRRTRYRKGGRKKLTPKQLRRIAKKSGLRKKRRKENSVEA